MRRNVSPSLVPLFLAAGATLPAMGVRLGLFRAPTIVEVLFFGAGIMGAAFILTWAAEVAQLHISQTLAIAALALIAVLPEYAVDLYLAFCAGQGDEGCVHLAIANMTGANRLLIGIGWAAVVLVFWARSGQRKVALRIEQRTDVGYLLLATLWAFSIPVRGQLSLIDLAVLGSLFVAYVIRAAREEVEEPELIGTAASLALLPHSRRRLAIVGLFLFGATIILSSAEPFAEGLRDIGEQFGISEFFLIQWLAPLASEAPEMIIAILFTLRARPDVGLGALISSKVNQWTLLVGTLPLVFSLAGAGLLTPMPLDSTQEQEVFLTAAQSIFAVAVIANLSISRLEAIGLLLLFSGQFAIQHLRMEFAVVYLVLFAGMVIFNRSVRTNLVDSMRHVLGRGARAEV
ncbi:MAG: sodium:calcium antiporter [Actinomycetota bacterium]|nr:sodium:calcium antiporter [Actinomycetota bacterium]